MQLERIIQTFEFLQDWESRYQFLIELGGKLDALQEADKIEDNRVHGCMSKVWIVARPSETHPGAIELRGDSDASTVKGLVALIVALYSDKTPEQILAADADELFHRLGLFDHLSPTRHVGVYAMVEFVRNLARGYADTETGDVARETGAGSYRPTLDSGSTPPYAVAGVPAVPPPPAAAV
jgi:cysteine desulfuration protein SufE